MNPVLTAIREWVAWFRRRKTAPIAQARARRVADILYTRAKRDRRRLHHLYRRQRDDTVDQLRMEVRR